MARLLRRVESIVPRRAAGYGGKAKNLAAMARAGFPVPAAFALPGQACEEFLRGALPSTDLPAALLAAPAEDVSGERLEALARKVRRAPMPAALADALREAFDILQREGARGIAVRSSSTREDQEDAAAAGLHATFLNIRSGEALLDAVRDCWASLYAYPVLTYLKRVGGAADASVGIVVQAMVPAEVSGVLFTVNPLTGDPGEMVVNASWGLGSEVVDGRVSPDTLRIDKSSGHPRDRIIGDKATRTVIADDGGVRREDVPEQERATFCLDDSLVDELVTLGLRIEEYFGNARDLEWAVAGGKVYLLQSRPVTTAIQPPLGRRARKRQLSRNERDSIVWSNVNVGEALPGVATPLTWSVASGFSELGFRRAFGSLGCPVPKEAELVGNFRGRIYLNLTEILSTLSQVPGLTPRSLLSLGGGGEVEHLERTVEERSSFGFIARLPVTAARFARENFRISRRVESFERVFEADRRRIGDMDLRVLSPIALDQTLTDVERLLDEAGSVMLTAYGNLLSSVVLLQGVLRTVARDRADLLQRELLTGLADVESAAPGLALWHIAEMASADEPTRARVRDADPASLHIADLDPGPTRRALENFIEAYGHRGPREAEIAEPRWREDPSLLFVALRLHLRREHDREQERPIDVERRQRAVRERAEREIEQLLPAPGRAAFRHLLGLVQRFTRLRERLRSHVVEVLGMFRRVALDASRRLGEAEEVAGREAAFFLTMEELHAALRGQARHVGELVRQRRRQYERDRALPDPPDTFIGFPPPVPPPPPETDALDGLAASAGRVQGRARVLSDTADLAHLEEGDILVAHCADVGWSPLFLLAGGVVTDLGGPLSHASIVLREYGVPAVVNVKVGTRIIRTGDWLDVDADAGRVQIVRSARGADDEPHPPGAELERP